MARKKNNIEENPEYLGWHVTEWEALPWESQRDTWRIRAAQTVPMGVEQSASQ
jgi:hypothetical protein